MSSQWTSLAVFTQVTDYLLDGDYNFNLRGEGGYRKCLSRCPAGMTMCPQMIGAPSKYKMEKLDNLSLTICSLL